MYCCHFTAAHSPWRHLTAIWPQFFTQIRPKLHKAAVLNFSRKLLQGGRWRALRKENKYPSFQSSTLRLGEFWITRVLENGWRDFKAGRMRWHIGAGTNFKHDDYRHQSWGPNLPFWFKMWHGLVCWHHTRCRRLGRGLEQFQKSVFKWPILQQMTNSLTNEIWGGGNLIFLFSSISVLPVSEGSNPGPQRRHQRRCWDRNGTAAFLFPSPSPGGFMCSEGSSCAASECQHLTFLIHTGCSRRHMWCLSCLASLPCNCDIFSFLSSRGSKPLGCQKRNNQFSMASDYFRSCLFFSSPAAAIPLLLTATYPWVIAQKARHFKSVRYYTAART